MSEERSATSSLVRPALRSAPWIAIVALTAAVQFVRAAPLDGVVFCAVAAALLADALGILPQLGPVARPGALPVLVGALTAGALLALTPRHGVIDGIVLVGAGVAALATGWPGLRPAARPDHPRRRAPRPGDATAVRRTAILWAAVGVATCLWELTSFVLQRVQPQQKAQHPAISDLLDPALDQLWFRALFVAGWIALGIALLARGGRR
jgi:hypothetical protein